MSFEQAFARHEANEKAAVMNDTWGYLFPKKGKHRGYIMFAETGYGQTELIDAGFEDTESSPWLFNTIQELVVGQRDLEPGLYVWRGYCYTESVLTYEADLDDPDDEDVYCEIIKLEGEIKSKKSIKELLMEGT